MDIIERPSAAKRPMNGITGRLYENRTGQGSAAYCSTFISSSSGMMLSEMTSAAVNSVISSSGVV